MDSQSAVCIYNIVKYNKHNRQISRRVHFVRNGDKLKLHKIDWCEGGMKLADIQTNNVGENDLDPIIKYIMVVLDN